jgi:ferredoxin
VRACDLAALGIRDRVLLADRYADVSYAQRREGWFIVAVRCTACEPTCFCGSMNTGPDQMSGYDLCLTEVIRPNRHVFLIESGSERGAEVLHALGATAAEPKLAAEAQAGVSGMLAAQTRHVDQDQIKEQLYAAFDHPRWEEVAERCLACGNCTQVCPTCFCMNIEDSSDITGETAVRNVVADSCFSMQFSYIHGGSVRVSAKSRYRQWLMHKLAYWIDQFGSSGCVGCGRCITWCPVGIDITEEASALRKRV